MPLARFQLGCTQCELHPSSALLPPSKRIFSFDQKNSLLLENGKPDDNNDKRLETKAAP
jgi:hypothetical protein